MGWTFPGDGDRNYHLLRFKYLHLLPESERYSSPVFRAGAVWETRHRMNHRNSFWLIEQRDYSRGISSMKAFCRTYPAGCPLSPGQVRLRVTMTWCPRVLTITHQPVLAACALVTCQTCPTSQLQ